MRCRAVLCGIHAAAVTGGNVAGDRAVGQLAAVPKMTDHRHQPAELPLIVQSDQVLTRADTGQPPPAWPILAVDRAVSERCLALVV